LQQQQLALVTLTKILNTLSVETAHKVAPNVMELIIALNV